MVFPRAACRIPHQELRMILGRPRILLFCVINIFSANSATKLLRQFLNLGTVAVQKQKRKKIINPLDRGAAAAFNFIILLFIRFSPTLLLGHRIENIHPQSLMMILRSNNNFKNIWQTLFHYHSVRRSFFQDQILIRMCFRQHKSSKLM